MKTPFTMDELNNLTEEQLKEAEAHIEEQALDIAAKIVPFLMGETLEEKIEIFRDNLMEYDHSNPAEVAEAEEFAAKIMLRLYGIRHMEVKEGLAEESFATVLPPVVSPVVSPMVSPRTEEPTANEIFEITQTDPLIQLAKESHANLIYDVDKDRLTFEHVILVEDIEPPRRHKSKSKKSSKHRTPLEKAVRAVRKTF